MDTILYRRFDQCDRLLDQPMAPHDRPTKGKKNNANPIKTQPNTWLFLFRATMWRCSTQYPPKPGRQGRKSMPKKWCLTPPWNNSNQWTKISRETLPIFCCCSLLKVFIIHFHPLFLSLYHFLKILTQSTFFSYSFSLFFSNFWPSLDADFHSHCLLSLCSPEFDPFIRLIIRDEQPFQPQLCFFSSGGGHKIGQNKLCERRERKMMKTRKKKKRIRGHRTKVCATIMLRPLCVSLSSRHCWRLHYFFFL